MRKDQMVVSQRQPKLLFKPSQFFGESIGTSCESAVALSLSQVITFYEAGIDGVAHRGLCQFLVNGI
jgi:hypothetical protein